MKKYCRGSQRRCAESFARASSPRDYKSGAGTCGRGLVYEHQVKLVSWSPTAVTEYFPYQCLALETYVFSEPSWCPTARARTLASGYSYNLHLTKKECEEADIAESRKSASNTYKRSARALLDTKKDYERALKELETSEKDYERIVGKKPPRTVRVKV